MHISEEKNICSNLALPVRFTYQELGSRLMKPLAFHIRLPFQTLNGTSNVPVGAELLSKDPSCRGPRSSNATL